jgi:hypothetical protein
MPVNFPILKAKVKPTVPKGLWYSRLRGQPIEVNKSSCCPYDKYKVVGSVLYISCEHVELV